jgi:glycosyltransferase involved in cell wall biosynthesis
MGRFPSGAPVRVGLVIYGSLDIVTGGFLYDRMLVNHLRSRGDEVEIFSLPWRHYAAHLSDNASGSWVRSLLKARVDVLLQDELNHPSLVLNNRKLRGRVSYPIVSIVHHLRASELRPAWQKCLYGMVERSYLSTVDGFVFNSATTRAAVQALMGADRPSVVAYPAGDRVSPHLGETEIQLRSTASGPLQILFVGALIQRKQLHTLIAALAMLPPGTARLDVVGSLSTDPSYVSGIRNAISTHKLDHAVRLLDTVTGPELEKRYAESQVLMVPSSYEGFGIVYLEAMGFGLPAVAGTAGAAHEIVTHGVDGFLVEPGDVGHLSRLILRLSADRELLARMGVQALKRYAKHPTWAESCAKIADFLDTMVK